MNISFSEIIVIALIALLVIRPEQMPEVAATVGKFVKTIRHLFGRIKTEMNDIIDPVERTNERQ